MRRRNVWGRAGIVSAVAVGSFWAQAACAVAAEGEGGDRDPLVAVSPTGPAHGTIAISGAGDASSPGTTGLALSAQGNASGGALAVGWGDAYAPGGLATVAVTGDGGGGSVTNVCPLGSCA